MSSPVHLFYLTLKLEDALLLYCSDKTISKYIWTCCEPAIHLIHHLLKMRILFNGSDESFYFSKCFDLLSDYLNV